MTTYQGYNIYKGKIAPWPALYRAISRRYNIDEHWLATGKLEVRADEGAAAAVKVWNVLADAARLSRNGQNDSAVYRGLPNDIHIDMGDPAGDRAVVMTRDDLKQASVGEPLQTLQQMKGQMESLKGAYSQNSQSENTSTSDQPS